MENEYINDLPMYSPGNPMLGDGPEQWKAEDDAKNEEFERELKEAGLWPF